MFCESEMTSLGALNCCYSPRWARRVLAFNHPATRVLHIMLKAGPQNLRWEGKISFQEGQVTKLIQSIQWLMCSAIATTWWSSVESSVKRNVWIQQKRKRASGPPLCIQPALSSNHYQQRVKLQLKWEYTFSPNANVHICRCRHRKHDIFSLSKWMHAYRPHYRSMKMSVNKHDNWILRATKMFQPRNTRAERVRVEQNILVAVPCNGP